MALGVSSGALASANLPTQPSGSPPLGTAVCQKPYRREVREARIGVSAALDDGHQAVLVEAFEAHQRGMEPGLVREMNRVLAANGEGGSHSVVLIVSERDDRVQAVVAPCEFDDDEDSLRVPFPVPFLRCECTRGAPKLSAGVPTALRFRRAHDAGNCASSRLWENGETSFLHPSWYSGEDRIT